MTQKQAVIFLAGFAFGMMVMVLIIFVFPRPLIGTSPTDDSYAFADVNEESIWVRPLADGRHKWLRQCPQNGLDDKCNLCHYTKYVIRTDTSWIDELKEVTNDN